MILRALSSAALLGLFVIPLCAQAPVPMQVELRSCARADSMLGPFSAAHQTVRARQSDSLTISMDVGTDDQPRTGVPRFEAMVSAPRRPRPNHIYYPTLVTHVTGELRRAFMTGEDRPPLLLQFDGGPAVDVFGSVYHSGQQSSSAGVTLINVRLDELLVIALAKADTARLQVGVVSLDIPRPIRTAIADAYRLTLCGYETP